MLRVVLLSSLLLFARQGAWAKTYVVSVGIASYQNIRGLSLTENDALAVSRLYKSCGASVITMTGRYATRASILKALSDQFARAGRGDMVVFFFSGHGYEGGFCPYDMGQHYEHALTYGDVYSVLRRSHATDKVIIADACMSGGLRQGKHRTSQPERKSTDVLMFLSSRTHEYSIESRRMKNGFFTTYLDRGLRGAADTNRDKRITAKEIFTYVSNGVQRLSGNRQHPVMWGRFSDDFVMMDWHRVHADGVCQ